MTYPIKPATTAIAHARLMLDQPDHRITYFTMPAELLEPHQVHYGDDGGKMSAAEVLAAFDFVDDLAEVIAETIDAGEDICAFVDREGRQWGMCVTPNDVIDLHRFSPAQGTDLARPVKTGSAGPHNKPFH